MKFSGFRILKSLKIAFLQIFRIQDPESSGSEDPAGKSQEGPNKLNQSVFCSSAPRTGGVAHQSCPPACLIVWTRIVVVVQSAKCGNGFQSVKVRFAGQSQENAVFLNYKEDSWGVLKVVIWTNCFRKCCSIAISNADR